MTLRERLQTIGSNIFGQTKEVPVQKEKGMSSGSFLFGVNESLTNYKTVSSRLMKANEGWVFKNTDVIAKEVATIEFELYSTRVVGGDIELVPITQHPLLDALDRFNEFTSASDGFYIIPSQKMLAGDSFMWIDGSGPNVRGLYLLSPDKITVKFGAWEGGQRLITGYKFEDTVDGDKKEETYDAEDVIQFKSPDPDNPYRGKSKVASAAEEIDTYNLAREANKGFFQRGMITNFFLSTEKSLTEEQTQTVTAKLNSAYQGAKNAFKIMILSGGLRPEPIQATNKDSQFIDQMKYYRDVIMSIWGNTPSVLGIVEDVNRANAEAGILNWKRTTVKSEMKSITDTLNEFFVPRFGSNLVLGFCDPVPEDRGTKVEEAVALVNAKIITQNEAREGLGYDASTEEDADVLNRQVQQFQIDPSQLPKSIQNIDFTKSFRRNGTYKQLALWQKLKEASKPLAQEIVRGRKSKASQKEVEPRYHPNFTNQVVMDYYGKQMHVVDVHEKIFQHKVEKFINNYVAKALEDVPEKVADMQEKAFVDDDEEVARAVIDFTPILNDVALLSGQQALSLVGDKSPFIAPDLRMGIEASVKKFAASMIDTDQQKIVDMIAQGVASGSSVTEIRKSITDAFESYSKMQAERITRTEVLRASMDGTLEAFKQSDVVIGKQWLTAGATDECAQYEGKVEYDLRGNFYSSSNEFQDGDPPLHPNCRCTLLPVIEGDKAYKPEPIMQRTILEDKIKELEAQVDKRTKAYRDIKKDKEDLEKYAKSLEEIVDEEPRTSTEE